MIGAFQFGFFPLTLPHHVRNQETNTLSDQSGAEKSSKPKGAKKNRIFYTVRTKKQKKDYLVLIELRG